MKIYSFSDRYMTVSTKGEKTKIKKLVHSGKIASYDIDAMQDNLYGLFIEECFLPDMSDSERKDKIKEYFQYMRHYSLQRFLEEFLPNVKYLCNKRESIFFDNMDSIRKKILAENEEYEKRTSDRWHYDNTYGVGVFISYGVRGYVMSDCEITDLINRAARDATKNRDFSILRYNSRKCADIICNYPIIFLPYKASVKVTHMESVISETMKYKDRLILFIMNTDVCASYPTLGRYSFVSNKESHDIHIYLNSERYLQNGTFIGMHNVSEICDVETLKECGYEYLLWVDELNNKYSNFKVY